MKKLLYLVYVIPCSVIAQVGVNTSTPQEELHIAGNTSTARVEGLSAANNTANLGAGNSTRVFVNANGDLVLGAATNNVEILFNPYNYLNDAQDTGGSDANVITQTGVGSGYTIAGWPRQIGAGLSTFTLTKSAIVEINYSLSWELEKNASSAPDDENARVIQTYMYLLKMPLTSHDPTFATGLVTTDLDGVPLTIGRALGLNGQFHTNAASDGAAKLFHNTGTDYVKLPAGRYCPMFAAQVAVGNTGGAGACKMYIGTGQDEVQVIAHYYN
ncbi:hypothetical protein LZZ90_02060 [Flavobacterium sp. SM15]|uniref:hypothetical protein n=1 Tax=Flavobacterium sp. SM15 TaxID=2908005 RepID=UPI001EDA0AE8|nr:hypothetical protein [Flavobacterium sp. SM15]MCG2610288.1 hypothetical protein [Flavobacterium sp. SM15]